MYPRRGKLSACRQPVTPCARCGKRHVAKGGEACLVLTLERRWEGADGFSPWPVFGLGALAHQRKQIIFDGETSRLGLAPRLANQAPAARGRQVAVHAQTPEFCRSLMPRSGCKSRAEQPRGHRDGAALEISAHGVPPLPPDYVISPASSCRRSPLLALMRRWRRGILAFLSLADRLRGPRSRHRPGVSSLVIFAKVRILAKLAGWNFLDAPETAFADIFCIFFVVTTCFQTKEDVKLGWCWRVSHAGFGADARLRSASWLMPRRFALR